MTVIEATLLGDSHAMVIDAAANASGRSFQHRFLEPFATFLGAKLSCTAPGQVEWIFGDVIKDFGEMNAERLQRRNDKAGSLSRRMSKVVASGLPIYSTLGVTPFSFMRSVVVAARKNKEDVSLIQSKIARVAANRHFDDYAAFYESISGLGIKITCIYSPTRYLPGTRKIWSAYEEVVAERLDQLKIGMIDIRADVGGDDLLLDPAYHADDPEDTVHANELWGSKVLDRIAEHVASGTVAAI